MLEQALKTLHVTWELPLNSKAYEELGRLFATILPFVKSIDFADYEGVVLKVSQEAIDIINEIKQGLRYVHVFEDGEE